MFQKNINLPRVKINGGLGVGGGGFDPMEQWPAPSGKVLE